MTRSLDYPEEERQEVYRAFAPDKEMRIYGRGIRRRLAPMLNNDRRWIELAYSLMFTLPGTPVLRYGDEIGMGDDLSLPERNSVRTTMQWSAEKHGGFSASANGRIPVPQISEGEFGYPKVNVHKQMLDPLSLLNWMERAIAARKECIEFGYGNYEVIPTEYPGVLAHVCRYKSGCTLAVHNLDEEAVAVVLDQDFQHMIEYFGDQRYEPVEVKTRRVQLGPFGYRWFRKSPLFL